MEGGEERGSPRDLLRWFSGGGLADEQPEVSREDWEEIELSLSLGSFFGTEPSGTKLLRSSSIAAVSELPIDSELTPASPLARTYSLPAEADEEQRKRKEMQARSNRLEAKRKKLEKTLKWAPPPPPPPPVMKERPVEVAAGKRQAEPSGFRKYSSGVLANGASVAPLPGWQVEAPGYFRNGSIASLGGSSSRASDFERRKMKGLEIPGLSRESGSASVMQPVPIHHAYCKPAMTHVAPPVAVHANHKAAITPVMQPVAAHVSHKAAITPVAQPVPTYAHHRAAISPVAQPVPVFANHKTASTHPEATRNSVNYGKDENDPLKKSIMGSNSIGQMDKMILEEMPCVSTRVPGPDGKRVEGFLYKYRNGEDVRIVCVCHGSFLTPAEFVKHAGGGEVAYPLKHIVVGPSPSGFWRG